MDDKGDKLEKHLLCSCTEQRQTARWRLLRQATADFMRDLDLTPPLSLDHLQDYASQAGACIEAEPDEINLLTVMVNNELWYKTVAAVPYENRLLLLPQCLRDREKCPGEIDEFGLICVECGSCALSDLQQEAEALGYMLLIAEGSGVVTGLLEKGDIDAVIGVSCLETLQESFHTITSQAVPGIAVPLLKNGCQCTTVDLQWLFELMRSRSDAAPPKRIAIDALRDEVQSWFKIDELQRFFEAGNESAAAIAAEWIAAHGKRWRPFLTVAVHDAVSSERDLGDLLQRAAIATECFHKASLIHDDIEDGDDVRYGEQTLHRQYGIPVALNIGDFLLGEGYRLIAESEAEPATISRMTAVIAQGHRELCLGQGEELIWMRNPQLIKVQQVLDIFRRKTAPAFEISLRLGVICAGKEAEFSTAIQRYSQALGIAYQIGDDIADFQTDLYTAGEGSQALQPSLLLALLCECRDASVQSALGRAFKEKLPLSECLPDLAAVVTESGVLQQARDMLTEQRQEAFVALNCIRNIPLKSLLTRLLHRIVPHV